jgi:hypothetical protein
MRTRIEDLPIIRVSILVANGYIGRDAVTALVRFSDDGVESTASKDRHLLTAPERIARLKGDKPARVNPRPGRRLDRRAPIGAALKRSLLVARRCGIAEFEKKLIDA